MTTVAVTGAAGFIGRWVVSELLERDYRVLGIDNLSNGTRKNIDEFEENNRFEFYEGDIRNDSDVDDILEDETDACIHLAAEIDVHESLEDPQGHFETNLIGSYNILEACRQTGTRLGVVGTCMVYDVAESEEGIDEMHPVNPASPYAGTKLAAENLAKSYYHGYNLPVTLMRPFNTYGPYQEDGVVPIFVDRDLRGEPLKIFGDGTQTRDLLYVTDCARFIVDATFADEALGEILNAGTGVDVSINELANLVASDETKITHIEHHHPQSEIEELRCDPTKASEVLGWEPKVSLEEGVECLREWMKEQNV